MRMTTADMLKGIPGKKAPSSGAPGTTLKVPLGGEVRVRRVGNGVVASVTDGSYRTVQEVIATDARDLKIE